MSQIIIYNDDNGDPVSITPAPECLETYSILEIAIKDVPADKRFKIIDVLDIPQDIPQKAWTVDESNLVDGVGGKSNEFSARAI
jgi:hypothetical protein